MLAAGVPVGVGAGPGTLSNCIGAFVRGIYRESSRRLPSRPLKQKKFAEYSYFTAYFSQFLADSVPIVRLIQVKSKYK